MSNLEYYHICKKCGGIAGWDPYFQSWICTRCGNQEPKPINNEIAITLNHPITEEEWDAITDVDFDRTERIYFNTKHGKKVEFVKVVRCKECAIKKHCRTSNTWAVPPGDNWFCADGVKGDSDGETEAKLLNPNPYGECARCGCLVDIRDEHNYCPRCGAKLIVETDGDVE